MLPRVLSKDLYLSKVVRPDENGIVGGGHRGESCHPSTKRTIAGLPRAVIELGRVPKDGA